MNKILCMLLSVCMLLCLTACGGDHAPTSETTLPAAQAESNEPTKWQSTETTEAAPTSDTTPATEATPTSDTTPATEATPTSDTTPATEPAMPTEDWEDPSLAVFRQSMVETPQLFAAAFFGYVPQDADPLAVMQGAAPQLCEDLPFLLAIPEERIIGTFGYLFCIVPADENATVAANRRSWNAETECYEEPQVLYRSESGFPILIMCPNEDWIPDTEIIITDPSGNVTIWSPYLDPSYHISTLYNDNAEALIFDFTSYDELPNPG